MRTKVPQLSDELVDLPLRIRQLHVSAEIGRQAFLRPLTLGAINLLSISKRLFTASSSR